MTCDDCRTKLTAYLDGELEGDRGTAVRGHLRGCEACRKVASDEAALRDGLRALPPIDPPASLWAGVQARLAAEEVAEAKRPAWRRWLSHWAVPQQLSLAGAAIATLVVLLVWKSHRVEQAPPPPAPVAVQHPEFQPSVAPPPAPPVLDTNDVTADLVAQPARETASYAQAAAELSKLADAARASWTDERKHAFDAKIATLQGAIDKASDARTRQAAYRALIRYLQGVTIREVASV